jgi:dolichyl-phosphate mannosyltransferase polypeptide 3
MWPTPPTLRAHRAGEIHRVNEIKANTQVSHQLPFYAVIVFGCYLLGRLGVAILTFNDVPEAHAELQKEIEQAKIELRQGKVEVD